MSAGGGFEGISLLELFKLEAESHCAALSEGLLTLEKSPADTAVIEPLMRAAHSIKGAARIVGLDVIVSLTHVMEERFLAAKGGREVLTSSRVDQMLRALDVLEEVRKLSEPELPAWSVAQADRIAELVAQLKAPPPTSAAKPVATPADRQTASAPTTAAAAEMPAANPSQAPVEPSAATTTSTSAKSASASVRVASTVLNRMLFLAGESTVEASRLQSLRTLLAGLKGRERALSAAAQSVSEVMKAGARDHTEASAANEIEELVGALTSAADGVQTALVEQSTRFDESFRRIEELSGALYTEVLRSRMRPFSEGVTPFPRMVRDIARQLGKSVDLRIEGESVEIDRDILQSLESPLTHMIRNSLDHGVEMPAERQTAGKSPNATITLAARHQSGMLLIEVRDDGRGIDPEFIRRKVVDRRMVDAATAERLTRAELMEFPFLPGFSTKQAVTELSGRGVGLDVVQSMVHAVSGSVTLESEPGRGVRFSMRLPVTRSVIRAAMVRIGGELFAMPLARLERIFLISAADAQPVQGRLQFTVDGHSIGLVQGTQVLGGEQTSIRTDALPVLVIATPGGDDRCGLIVDEVCGEEDLVVRPLDSRLGTVPHIAAAAIGSDGEPLLVVDVDDLWRSVKQSLQGGRILGVAALHEAAAKSAQRRILVVDDSITVREVERQLLLRRGYHVDVAVDGKEGFNALRAAGARYDLLLTDVDMPRMNGIELIRAVRREPRFADMPIIIVSYKDREEDRLLGMEAGASAYLTKSSFQDDSLIRMVEDLIGASV